MSSIAEIFDRMRATEMNHWVGGSDPEAVGDASAAVVRRMLPWDGNARVLDFGCNMVSLLRNLVVVTKPHAHEKQDEIIYTPLVDRSQFDRKD